MEKEPKYAICPNCGRYINWFKETEGNFFCDQKETGCGLTFSWNRCEIVYEDEEEK